MTDINYTLSLFSRSRFSYQYEREDNLASIFSQMAYEEAQLGNLDNFNKIITHPRFSDYCSKKLFTRFFSMFSYDIIEQKDINEEESEKFLDSAFESFLSLNKLNFGILYKEHRYEYYYLFDPEDGKVRNLKRIEMLLDYVSSNKIFIRALGLDIAQIFDFDDIDLDTEFKDKIEKYKLTSEYDHSVTDLINYCRNGYIDLSPEYEEKIDFKNKEKDELFKILLAIGFHYDKNTTIGEKDTSYKEGNTCYSRSESYFKEGNVPDIFNNPYTNFKECIDILSEVMGITLSDKEKSLMLLTYQDIHKNIYKYD